MKDLLRKVFLMAIACSLISMPAFAEEMSNYQLMQELKAMKDRINQLEKELEKKDQEMSQIKEKVSISDVAEEALGWTEKIGLSGAIEVEYGSEKADAIDPATLQTQSVRNDDIVLSTVELGLEVEINDFTQGNVVLLYEDDEDGDRLRVDGATVYLGGTEAFGGFYFMGGKYCPHFGELNTYFLSDPLTQELFEAGETAIEAGYEQDWFTLSAGLFRGYVEENFETDLNINGFFGDFNIHNPEGTLGGANLLMGLSYISNVAESDTLQDEVVDTNLDGSPNDLQEFVDGMAAYAVLEYDIFSFGIEYITALDEFEIGEMGYAVNRVGAAMRSKPSAYNLEFAVNVMEPLQLGVKYEGTKDMFGLIPDKQYGIVANYDLFANTTLSAEFLHGKYEEDNTNADGLFSDERDLLTVKMAFEF